MRESVRPRALLLKAGVMRSTHEGQGLPHAALNHIGNIFLIPKA